MNRIEFFQRQKEILEKLFSIEWFYRVKQRKHPAYQQWALCKKIIEQGGSIKFPEQMEQLHEIGRILLNSYILVELTEGDLQQLKLGSIDLYGDETVQKKIHSRIPEPEQFEDLMIELYVGAWYKTKSHFVEPMERKGCPDLKIEIPDIDNPVFIECKHLRTLSKNRLQTVIKKANKQVKNAIKATGIPSYGVVILDVSTPIIVQQVENDNLPPTLQEIIETVRSILSGEKNRSIGAAVIVWDDYMLKGNPPNSTLVAFRRRHKHVLHENPILPIPKNLPLFEGYTTTYWLHWIPRRQPIKHYIFSDLFKKECQDKFNIKQTDLIESIQKSEKTESVIFNGQKELMFFLHRIPSKREFYILVCGERKEQSLIIHWAFKIFTDLCKEIHLLSPIQLLERFVDSYGLLVTIGDLTSKFIFVHRIEVNNLISTCLWNIHNPENHSFMNCSLIKVSPTDRNSFIIDCALAFCIDTTRYMKWINPQNCK